MTGAAREGNWARLKNSIGTESPKPRCLVPNSVACVRGDISEIIKFRMQTVLRRENGTSGRVGRLMALMATAWLAMSCGPGDTAYHLARKAELRKDWDTALVNYQKALDSQPENAKYVIHERVCRTNASLFHLKRGQGLFAGGRVDDAAGEFQKAVGIDPSNLAAAAELNKVLAIQAEAKKQRETKLKEALKARQAEAVPVGVQLKPLSEEPIGRFKLSGDSRRVFETIGKMADLNVAFTADFHPVPVTEDLANVKIGDILTIVCYQTKRTAVDTDQRRHYSEPEVAA